MRTFMRRIKHNIATIKSTKIKRNHIQTLNMGEDIGTALLFTVRRKVNIKFDIHFKNVKPSRYEIQWFSKSKES